MEFSFTNTKKAEKLSEEEVKVWVDSFIAVLSEFLSDRVFIQDYNNAYPIDVDLVMLSDICPDLDSVKCGYLIESILSCYDSPRGTTKIDLSTASTSNPLHADGDYKGPTSFTNGNRSGVKNKVKGIELQSLISAVKDIMPHLGDGFVQKCLEYYDYNSASVINAVLESTLPEPLECFDREMPAIDEPPDPEEENGLPERVNVFDNDEYDIMTRDNVDISNFHKGKRKPEYKDANSMLNDKTHVQQLKDSYARLSLVDDTMDSIYDDEYDDTYDDNDRNVMVEEPGDPERRPFTTPRVLQRSSNNVDDYDDESEEDEQEDLRKTRDHFIENPEVVRARMEEQRRQKFHNRSFKPSSRDVVGKPKGQGQSEDVTRNRDIKNTHKSSHSNHNRRSGAQWKKRQGMMS